MSMGYIAKYSRRAERTADTGSLKIRMVACKKDKLIEMMSSEKYIVWNADFCNLDEYLLNHSDTVIERKY